MVRRRCTRNASITPLPTSDSEDDEDDIFGARKHQQEEAALAERRRRIAQSAVVQAPLTHKPQVGHNECERSGKHSSTALAPEPKSSSNERVAKGEERNEQAHPSRKRSNSDSAARVTNARLSTSTMKRQKVSNKPGCGDDVQPMFDMFAPGAVAPAAAPSRALATGVDAPVEADGYARVRPGRRYARGGTWWRRSWGGACLRVCFGRRSGRRGGRWPSRYRGRTRRCGGRRCASWRR